jgi:predicted nucleotidyltransferase
LPPTFQSIIHIEPTLNVFQPTLYVFGSVVSDKFTEKSDIDFLISFSDGLTVDDVVIWGIISNHLPKLKKEVEDYLKTE